MGFMDGCYRASVFRMRSILGSIFDSEGIMAKSGIIRLFLASILTLVTFISLVLPVSADDPSKSKYQINLKAGDKVKLSNSLEATFTGNYDKDSGKPIWTSRISAPIYAGDYTKGIKIDTRWFLQSGVYYTGANTFYATYKGGQVTINQGETSWNPQIFLRYNKQVQKTHLIGEPYVINDYINSYYQQNILRLTYQADNGFIFFRDLRIIEGVLCEYYKFDSNPNADIVIDEGIKGSKAHLQSVSAWDSSTPKKNIKVEVTEDTKIVYANSIKNISYPIFIDPTNTYYTSASDGFLDYWNWVGSTWAATTANTVSSSETTIGIGMILWGGGLTDERWRSCMYFDTSSLPDTANITSAKLGVYGQTNASTTDFDIQITNGQSTYPHDPLQAGDYNKANYTGDGGTYNTAGFSTSGYNNITLNATGLGWINTSGTTKYYLISSRDYVGNSPSNNEYVIVYSYEQGAGYRPFLEVTYTAIMPTVSTSAATNVACTTATLNGDITNTGGETPTFRGFIYGTTSNTTKPAAGQIPPAGYTTNTSEGGSFTTGAFSANIASLTKGNTYYYRAYSYNSGGYGYGDQDSFTCWNNPTITRDAATTVTATTARLQSTLNSGGGTTCQVMWGWGTTDKGTAIETYDHWVTWSGSWATGDTPYYDVSSLNVSTTYYFNVKASNTCGNTTATSGSFATGSGISAPTNALAIPTGNSTITVSWNKVSTTPQTNIRVGENFAPTSNITGAFLYRGIASVLVHTNLTQGSTYYYYLQGWDAALGFSAGNVTVSCTVPAETSAATPITTPIQPSNWFAEPSSTTVSTYNPLSVYIDAMADSLGMPRNMWWFSLAILGIIVGAFLTARFTHNTPAVCIVIGVLMSAGSTAGLIPGVLAFLVGIICVAIIVASNRGYIG